MYKRFEDKKIEGNYVGEGYVAGGIIIFDSKGEPQYIYEEDTGEEFVVENKVAALELIRDAQQPSETIPSGTGEGFSEL